MLLKTIVSLACIITLVNAGPNRLTEPKDVVITDYNSGFIPGTKIRVEGLTNSATGKPVDFAKFTDKFLAIPAPASVAKNSLVKRDEDGLRGHDDNSKYLRMLCIPLISKNPTGNPYHKDLVSYENPHYFRGPGYPMVFPVSGVRCPKDSPGPCGITVTKEITYTNTLAYAVSDSKSNSFSKNVGGSRSSSNSSSTAITISESIEHSTTVSKTKTTEESTAHQFGDVTSTGWDKGNVTLQSNTAGTDTSAGTSTNDEENESRHVEASGSYTGGVNGGLTGATSTVTVSASGGKNWGSSNSKGTTNSKTDSLSDTNSFSGSINDNYSKAVTDLTTGTKGSSESDTNSETNGSTNTNSKMDTNTVEFTASEDWGSSNSTETGTGSSNTTTSASTQSQSMGYSFQVTPGKCKRLVCFPDTDMIIAPYLCGDSVEHTAVRTHAVVSTLVSIDGRFNCDVGLVACEDVINNSIPMVPVDDTVSTITHANAIKVGEVLDAGRHLTSENEEYTARVASNGNFIVYKSDTIKVWETGGNPFFGDNYPSRVRINERGHLVTETKNMWSKVEPSYRPDEWIQSWSTQAFGNNYTVGTPRRYDSTSDEYVLVLDNNGRLVMYDAAYVKIWCSYEDVGKPCVNSKGFKYQENYLLPLDMPTGLADQGAKDPHNSILFNTKVKNVDHIVSIDKDCKSGIKGGEGMQSPNGRFKVLLYPTGNMVIKDGVSDMYVGYSSNTPIAVAPYRLIVTDEGDLVVTDSANQWVWVGGNQVDRKSPPYTATILDEGRLVVTSSNGTEVWESWPQRGMNIARRLDKIFRVCYKPCGGCASKKTNTTVTIVNTIMAPTKTVNTTTFATITSVPTVGPKPNQEDMITKCNKWMNDYNVDPFVSYGNMKDLAMQAQWQHYDCACFGVYLKYKVEVLRTHLGKWGSLKDGNIRKLYTDSSCNCAVGQNIYKILPSPKNWGSLTDTTLQTRWNVEKCDADINKEPFIMNPNSGGSNAVMTTITDYTTNIVDAYVTNFVNSTETHVVSTITTVTSPLPVTRITAITTGITINATAYVTDMKTIGITTGITVTTVGATVTQTTPIGPKPTCIAGYYGKQNNGPSGVCCKDDEDCNQNCMNGVCGTCGKDFMC